MRALVWYSGSLCRMCSRYFANTRFTSEMFRILASLNTAAIESKGVRLYAALLHEKQSVRAVQRCSPALSVELSSAIPCVVAWQFPKRTSTEDLQYLTSYRIE